MFFPLGTTRPCWRKPYATYVLILLSVAIYFINPDIRTWGFLPVYPSALTWFTSLFLHASLLHLFGNMLFLWIFGSIAEDVLGPWVFLGFYYCGGAGATLLDWWISANYVPTSLTFYRIGASGAIAGIMGLAAVCFTRTKVNVWYFLIRTGTVMVGAAVFIALWAAWEVALGLLMIYIQLLLKVAIPGTAHWSHVGGFAVGLLGALAFGLHKKVGRVDLVSGRRAVTSSFEGFSQIGELEQLIRNSPQDAEAHYALGRAKEISGLAKDARRAYETALILFLRQRRMKDAIRAYRAIEAYNALISCPNDVQFTLASAFEEAGYMKEAFALFKQVAETQHARPEAESALFRAGEIARTALEDFVTAGECYQRLMRDYPHSQWQALCAERIRQLGLK